MKTLLLCVFVLFTASMGSHAGSTPKVVKILPQFLDLKGRTALSPSLFDRDAYQADLRKNAKLCSGMVFKIQTAKVRKGMTLVLELRTSDGAFPPTKLETRLARSGWTAIRWDGAEFARHGAPLAWRATLIENGTQVGHQSSFLW